MNYTVQADYGLANVALCRRRSQLCHVLTNPRNQRDALCKCTSDGYLISC